MPPSAHQPTENSPSGQSGPGDYGPLLAAYRQKCDSGALKPDPAQQAALLALDRLAAALDDHATRPRWFWQKPAAAPRGVYLWGPVGRGKSMLMDLFMATAPVALKRRVHFHAFMLEVHGRIHAWRQSHAGDPLPDVADDIAKDTHLLCFDEFQVTDIADAMILGRLFTALFAKGVVVVATSNTPPDRLYEGGLQRDLFLPFIALLRQRTDTVAVAGAEDYRRRRLVGTVTYHTPLSPETANLVLREFAALTDGAAGQPDLLDVGGRRLAVPKAAHGVAWFSFDALCRQPLGAADFEAIAAAYPTLVISGIPIIPPEETNTARRFVILIDTLYEHHTHLICTAAAAPEWLYPAGELVKEFERTVSRLYEMQGRDWWKLQS